MGSEGLIIGLVVLGWLLWRQLQVRELRRDRSQLFPLALVVVGTVEIASYGRDHPLHATGIALLATSVVVAAAFGVLRAGTVRLWTEDGRLLRQGTLVTAALWLPAIAIHIGGDQLIAPHDAERIGAVSLLLYLGVSLAVQRACLSERARRLTPTDALTLGQGQRSIGRQRDGAARAVEPGGGGNRGRARDGAARGDGDRGPVGARASRFRGSKWAPHAHKEPRNGATCRRPVDPAVPAGRPGREGIRPRVGTVGTIGTGA